MPSEWRIGIAKADITPPLGCQMAGFDARKGVAEGIHDRLWSRALVLHDGASTVALVSLDIIGVGESFARQVRFEIERSTGIPSARVILAATHTHCGPVTFQHFFNQGQPLDDEYLAHLARRVAGSVVEAHGSLRPRLLSGGLVPVSGVAVNRRTADGLPVDPQAGVLAVRELTGEPVAVAVNYACHPTVLGPNTLEISADFPYFMTERLRAGLGVEGLFWNGAEGDLSIGHKSDLSAVGVVAPFRTFQKAQELGTRMADQVLAGVAALPPLEPSIIVRHAGVPLPLKTYPPLAEMSGRVESTARQVEATGDPQALLVAKQAYLFARIERYYASLEEAAPGRSPEKTLAAELTAIRLGDAALLTYPGEVFAAIALDVRSRSRWPATFFLGLANGYIGYVPTASADAHAGYEVVASRVTAGAAAILTEASAALLESLAG